MTTYYHSENWKKRSPRIYDKLITNVKPKTRVIFKIYKKKGSKTQVKCEPVSITSNPRNFS